MDNLTSKYEEIRTIEFITLSNMFKISVRFGHMHGLVDEAFFALVAQLRAKKITKPSNSGSREN